MTPWPGRCPGLALLDHYQPHVNRRRNEGCRDAAVLHAEITQLGYQGSLRTIYRYLQPLRTAGAAASAVTPPPKIGEVASRLRHRIRDRDSRDQRLLADLRSRCSQLDRLADHVTSFAKMMTTSTGESDFADWLKRVEADDQPELRSFDPGSARTWPPPPRSPGTVEGNVNGLKTIKRQMYGRASLDLLRKRVIYHHA